MSAFSIFDLIFGRYTRYGTVETKPSGEDTLLMGRDNWIITFSDGLPICAHDFKRRKVYNLGINLKFNRDCDTLSISLRYTCKKVADNSILLSIL